MLDHEWSPPKDIDSMARGEGRNEARSRGIRSARREMSKILNRRLAMLDMKRKR